ncbi:sensor histidine kinase [Clostridium sp. CM028]|uniref:sensor histidine kinase n=1 Tax=Clostridium sp. CM028 TaxID=2851575 RepID=UPI001C6F29E2|nr:sensor histidine kinase [Clostridium sp. CM028]MBW9148608.1 sensor histidine kinase [Clostridium sp. CM028]WLC60799.1 sensor histidine kinase [Clostridium sp. CM028]
MTIMTYIKNSALKILYFICILFTINLILLSSNPIDAQFTDIAYMDFLLLFISLIFTFIDYKRWAYSYKGICEAINNKDKVDTRLPSSSYYFEVQLIKDIVKLKNVEMEEKVQEVKSDLDEMNDYITKWVHEIKIPVSVCELIAGKIEEITMSEQLILEFNRINFLINQVLYTSRSSSYSEDLQINEINIETLIKKVVRRNATLFISKNISLELGNINYTVTTDEKWLSYIVDQLINNACKYVPNDGKITICVNEESKVIVLHVKDNGIGIKEKDIKRIFDRGFTGENGRILAKSTGMGLYLSKKMAHKLSHNIYVKSEEEKGTEFSVCFYKLSDYAKVT